MSSNADDTITTNGVAPEELPADTACEAKTPPDDQPADSGPAAEAAAESGPDAGDGAAAAAAQAAAPPAAAAATAGLADEEAAEPEAKDVPDQQEAQEVAAPVEQEADDAPDGPGSEDAPIIDLEPEDAPDEPETTEDTKPRQVAAAKDEEFVEDGRADQALDFVVDVLTTMGMDCTVDLMENDENDPPSDIRIEITGKDADRLIGKKGQTLAAMQFLTNRVVNRPSKPRRHILIDADGYRARREHALSSMAQRLGKQAVEEGKIITFEPMTAQDRRVVHLALVKFPGVVTKSEGKGSTRRVQIIPVRD